MKGPGLRIVHDVQRVWKCPKCNRQLKTEGWVTSRRCKCGGGGAWMRIVEKSSPQPIPVAQQQEEESEEKTEPQPETGESSIPPEPPEEPNSHYS